MTLLVTAKRFEHIVEAAQSDWPPATIRPGKTFESMVPATTGIVPETAKGNPPSESIKPEWLDEPPSSQPEALRNPAVIISKIYEAASRATGLDAWLIDYLTHRLTGHKKFIDLINLPGRQRIWTERGDYYQQLADAYDAGQAAVGSRLRAIRQSGAPHSRPLPRYETAEEESTRPSVREPEKTFKTGVDALDSALELMQLSVRWLDADNKEKAKKNILQAISIVHFWANEFTNEEQA